MKPTASATHSVRRMWPVGPLRRWSPVRNTGCGMPLTKGGFGGSYVCDGCSEPVRGVYRVIDRVEERTSWLCAACKAQQATTVSQKGKGPDVLAAHQALNGMA